VSLRSVQRRTRLSSPTAIALTIRDFLDSDEAGLPIDAYEEAEVQ